MGCCMVAGLLHSRRPVTFRFKCCAFRALLDVSEARLRSVKGFTTPEIVQQATWQEGRIYHTSHLQMLYMPIQ